MSSSRRNIDVLEKISDYCIQIQNARKRFGDTLEALKTDNDYKNAVAMCILQIGELTTLLSDEFKAVYSDMPWQDIKRMRNIAAHRYGEFDVEVLWGTVSDDIPALENYCNTIIGQYHAMQQEAGEEPDPEMDVEMKME